MTNTLKKKLKKMINSGEKKMKTFKKFASIKTVKIIKMFQDVSNKFTALVEGSSNIWKNEKKCHEQGRL